MDQWHWPHFAPVEVACSHCGELRICVDLLDKLEIQRRAGNQAIVVSSVYRCPVWNAMVGGAPLSAHKRSAAADQTLRGQDREVIYRRAKEAGFLGFGWYRSFLHTDTGPRREWGDR